jgi:hypothetical protein
MKVSGRVNPGQKNSHGSQVLRVVDTVIEPSIRSSLHCSPREYAQERLFSYVNAVVLESLGELGPHLAQVLLTVFGKQRSEGALLYQRRPHIALLKGLDFPMVDIGVVPCCRRKRCKALQKYEQRPYACPCGTSCGSWVPPWPPEPSPLRPSSRGTGVQAVAGGEFENAANNRAGPPRPRSRPSAEPHPTHKKFML